jgi:hypothetical protein
MTLIKAIFRGGRCDYLNPFLLDRLIYSGYIQKFLRSDGWVTVGEDRIRGTGGKYKGIERRHSTNKPEFIRY